MTATLAHADRRDGPLKPIAYIYYLPPSLSLSYEIEIPLVHMYIRRLINILLHVHYSTLEIEIKFSKLDAQNR